MNKEESLLAVFNKIFELNVCGEDPLKVKRDLSKTNLNAKIMIVAEAMAPEQVRLSGINYFYINGLLGTTGRLLEKFLNKFNSTVYPDKPNCVYHTEIVHNFPGYKVTSNKREIRRPTKNEIKLAIKSGILREEIEIIKPKLILLMGNTAYKTFYSCFLKTKCINNLSEEIERISKIGKYLEYMNIPVIPIQHSSGANPRFNQMLKNEPLINIIRTILI